MKNLFFYILLGALPAFSFGAGIEITVEDDLTVSGTGGTALDPDVGIKGFSVFGSTQSSYTGSVIGPGNVVINGYLSVSSGAYFVGNSTFPGAGNIFINNGNNGQVLQKTASGNLSWYAPLSWDNLGNHIATMTLNMSGFDIVNVSTIVVSSITTTSDGVVFSTNVFVTQGNVGLGTTQPGAKLDVAGRVKTTEFQLGVSTTAGHVLVADSSGVGTWQKQSAQYIHVRDEKANNTAGGGSAAGWQTRTLNTTVTNTIDGASLASNQITLQAGTYKVYARSPACYTSGTGGMSFRCALYNVTDSAYTALGSSMIAYYMHDSFITDTVFTITAQKVFELRHYASTAQTTNGLGCLVNSGDIEVYSEVFIMKLPE